MTPIPELYAQGVPLKEIARLHGLTMWKLNRRIEALGLRRYKTLTTSEINKLRELSHLGNKAAAARMGTTLGRVRYIRRDHIDSL